MTELSALWLPILLSGVFVFVASSIIHMALPWHKSDYLKAPNEDRVMDGIRAMAIPPGDYMIPRPATRDDMRSKAFAEKMAKGPVLVMTVFPAGSMSMGRNLALWFLYCVIVSGFAALVAGGAVQPGADSHAAFHFSAITAFVGYSVALWQMSIWYRRSWATTVKATIDGLIYAVMTGATFMWLWPQ